MTTVLNQLFGKNQGLQRLAGDVEFWHGVERAGWLEKQGRKEYRLEVKPSTGSESLDTLCACAGEFLPNWRRR